MPPNGVVFLRLQSETEYNIQAVFVGRGIIFQMPESFKILSAILTVERRHTTTQNLLDNPPPPPRAWRSEKECY